MAEAGGIQIGDTVMVVEVGLSDGVVTAWHPDGSRLLKNGDRLRVAGLVDDQIGTQVHYIDEYGSTDYVYVKQVIKVADTKVKVERSDEASCCSDEGCSSDFVRIVGDEIVRRFGTPAGKFSMDVMDAINRLGEMESVHGTVDVQATVEIKLLDNGCDLRERHHNVSLSEVFEFLGDDENKEDNEDDD